VKAARTRPKMKQTALAPSKAAPEIRKDHRKT
jgi:hypothetical protein